MRCPAMGTCAILALLVAACPARAAWHQSRFEIGAYAVFPASARPDAARLSLLDGAGIDWVSCFSENSPRRAVRLAALVDSLRRYRRGFAMRNLPHIFFVEPGDEGFVRTFQNDNVALDPRSVRKSLDPSRGINRPSTFGFDVWDEPCDEVSFRNLGLLQNLIDTCSVCADRVGYVNLHPIHVYDWTAGVDTSCYYRRFGAGSGMTKAEGYAAYLRTYLSQFEARGRVAPLLSFDCYPFQISDAVLNDWFMNLRIVRDVTSARRAKAARVPFRVVVQLSPYDPVGRPSSTFGFVHTRWQVYTALAYGAKGITYWLATGAAPEWGPGILRDDGDTVAVRYSQLRALDRDLHRLGPTLMKLDAVSTVHQQLLGAVGIDDEAIGAAKARDLVAGFRGAGSESAMAGHLVDRSNGGDYLFVVNKSLTRSAAFTVRLTRRARSVVRVRHADGGGPAVARGASSFTTSPLAPGQGELFRIL